MMESIGNGNNVAVFKSIIMQKKGVVVQRKIMKLMIRMLSGIALIVIPVKEFGSKIAKMSNEKE